MNTLMATALIRTFGHGTSGAENDRLLSIQRLIVQLHCTDASMHGSLALSQLQSHLHISQGFPTNIQHRHHSRCVISTAGKPCPVDSQSKLLTPLCIAASFSPSRSIQGAKHSRRRRKNNIERA